MERSAGRDVATALSALQSGWRDNQQHEFTVERQRSDDRTGRWRDLDRTGFWWSSTIIEALGSVQVRQITPQRDFNSTLNDRANGLSVRCIQNPQTKKISRRFTDTRDGKQYGVVVIGNAIWMKDNLNFNAKGSFCYDNKPENCDKYGRLYEWDLAQTVCAAGWRLSNHNDWLNLADNSGKNNAGKRLKSKQWNGTDNHGFSALPGGFTKAQGYSESGERGYWWTSDTHGPNGRYNFMSSDRDSVTHSAYPKSFAFSVRCVQDCGLFRCVAE